MAENLDSPSPPAQSWWAWIVQFFRNLWAWLFSETPKTAPQPTPTAIQSAHAPIIPIEHVQQDARSSTSSVQKAPKDSLSPTASEAPSTPALTDALDFNGIDWSTSNDSIFVRLIDDREIPFLVTSVGELMNENASSLVSFLGGLRDIYAPFIIIYSNSPTQCHQSSNDAHWKLAYVHLSSNLVYMLDSQNHPCDNTSPFASHLWRHLRAFKYLSADQQKLRRQQREAGVLSWFQAEGRLALLKYFLENIIQSQETEHHLKDQAEKFLAALEKPNFASETHQHIPGYYLRDEWMMQCLSPSLSEENQQILIQLGHHYRNLELLQRSLRGEYSNSIAEIGNEEDPEDCAAYVFEDLTFGPMRTARPLQESRDHTNCGYYVALFAWALEAMNDSASAIKLLNALENERHNKIEVSESFFSFFRSNPVLRERLSKPEASTLDRIIGLMRKAAPPRKAPSKPQESQRLLALAHQELIDFADRLAWEQESTPSTESTLRINA